MGTQPLPEAIGGPAVLLDKQRTLCNNEQYAGLPAQEGEGNAMREKKKWRQAAELPMKWHKFLIQFPLWAIPVIFIVMGLILMTGYIYGDSAAQMYADNNGLRVCDIIVGLCSVGIGVYAVFVRYALVGLKAGAPKKLSLLFLLNGAFALVQALLMWLIMGTSLGADVALSLVGCVLMVCIHRVYYGKRAHLFVN